MKRKFALILFILVSLLINPILITNPSYAFAFNEDFSTTNYKDSANTTAIWDTSLKKSYLPNSNNWQLFWDSPQSYIYCIASYNNKLYAGSGNEGIIYEYDGENWGTSYDSPETSIYCFEVYKNKLYAGSSAGKIYVYDGTSWNLSHDSGTTSVRSLTVFNNNLYAGTGILGKIFVYDGTNPWALAYGSPANTIRSLAVYNNKLYAGSYSEGKIYAYDGTNPWSEVFDSDETSIESLAQFKGKLYAGTIEHGIIYVYDGTTWQESFDSPEGRIYWLEEYENRLYAGTQSLGIIYVFDGNSWKISYTSPQPAITCLENFGGELYASGGPYGQIFKGPDKFVNSAQAQSKKINTSDYNIEKATLTSVQSLNSQKIDYYLSPNGGTNWEAVTTGVEHTFANQGNDLRWKAVLSTTDNSVTPEIDSLTIDYSSDTTPPTGSISINSGANFTTTSSVTLTLTATDSETGVSGMCFSNNNTSWSGWESFAPAKSWTLSAGDGTKTVYVKYKDGASPANESTYSASIILDSTKPSGSILINNGDAFTHSPQVSLLLQATDNIDVVWMLLSNDSSFTGASWDAYQSSLNWTLSTGDGEKIVYVKYKDTAGNSSQAYSDSITLLSQKITKRLAGPTRYETAVEISKYGWNTSNAVILARGDLFPDALSGASLAKKENAPILLTNSQSLTVSTKNEISRLKAKKVFILGSDNAIYPQVIDDIKSQLGITDIERYGGDTRYETASIIAQQLTPMTTDTAIIATGENYPDALASASLSYYKKIPILLVRGDIGVVPQATLEALEKLNIKSLYIVGGTDVVPQGIEDTLKEQGYSTQRLAGPTRYETCRIIADKGLSLGMVRDVISVAVGENFPDALTLGPLAGKNSGPLLLVRTTFIPGSIEDFIKNNKNEIYLGLIAGGTDVVSQGVEDQILNMIK